MFTNISVVQYDKLQPRWHLCTFPDTCLGSLHLGLAQTRDCLGSCSGNMMDLHQNLSQRKVQQIHGICETCIFASSAPGIRGVSQPSIRQDRLQPWLCTLAPASLGNSQAGWSHLVWDNTAGFPGFQAVWDHIK